MKTVTRKIGLNRGKRRIWLEGAVLTNAEIYHGMRFDVLNFTNVLRILIRPEGKRKVAGTPARPIIDMSGATVTNSFSDDVTVVEVRPAGIGLKLVAVKS